MSWYSILLFFTTPVPECHPPTQNELYNLQNATRTHSWIRLLLTQGIDQRQFFILFMFRIHSYHYRYLCQRIWSRPYQVPARKNLLDLKGLGAADAGSSYLRKWWRRRFWCRSFAAACHWLCPAAFSRRGKYILDPTFCKAGVLKPARFATTFHPVDLGILDEIEKQLLPSFDAGASRKLIADLSSLIVGLFPFSFDSKGYTVGRIRDHLLNMRTGLLQPQRLHPEAPQYPLQWESIWLARSVPAFPVRRGEPICATQ